MSDSIPTFQKIEFQPLGQEEVCVDLTTNEGKNYFFKVKGPLDQKTLEKDYGEKFTAMIHFAEIMLMKGGETLTLQKDKVLEYVDNKHKIYTYQMKDPKRPAEMQAAFLFQKAMEGGDDQVEIELTLPPPGRRAAIANEVPVVVAAPIDVPHRVSDGNLRMKGPDFRIQREAWLKREIGVNDAVVKAMTPSVFGKLLWMITRLFKGGKKGQAEENFKQQQATGRWMRVELATIKKTNDEWVQFENENAEASRIVQDISNKVYKSKHWEEDRALVQKVLDEHGKWGQHGKLVFGSTGDYIADKAKYEEAIDWFDTAPAA